MLIGSNLASPRTQRGALTCALHAVLLAASVRSLETEVAVQVSRSVFQHKGLSHIVGALCDNAGDCSLSSTFQVNIQSILHNPRYSTC